jgi:hypothetical protein
MRAGAGAAEGCRNRATRMRCFATEPEHGLDAALATGKLAPNMEVTHRVRVVFDEPPIEATGKPPTSVFLAGCRKVPTESRSSTRCEMTTMTD